MTDHATLAAQATRLRALHSAGDPLLLANVWDAATARAVADAGFPAVATSSSAVAASLGFQDHEQAPAGEMFAALRRISRVVEVPVTADIEAGYGFSADEIVARLLDAGAVGCNLEDTDHRTHALVDPERQADRLWAVRGAADAAGVGIVINARIDCWLRPGAESDRLADGLRRAAQYRQAGADCVYPIAVRDPDSLARFIESAGGPVNVLCTPNGISASQATDLGAARISVGGSLHHSQMAAFAATIRGLFAAQP